REPASPVPPEPNLSPSPRAAVPPAPTVPLANDTPPAPAPLEIKEPVAEAAASTDAKPEQPAEPFNSSAAPIDFSAESTIDQQQAPEPKGSKKKKKHHFGAIFLAVVFALALIGGAGFAYWQNQQN